MADLGYVDGRTIIIDAQSTSGDVGRGLALIDALVGRPVDVLLSPGPAAARAIVKKTNIPVVAVALPAVQSDPDLCRSLARPGGSLTGFAAFGEEMSAKRIQMLREVVPGLKRLGVMNNATDPTFSAWVLKPCRKHAWRASSRCGSASPSLRPQRWRSNSKYSQMPEATP